MKRFLLVGVIVLAVFVLVAQAQSPQGGVRINGQRNGLVVNKGAYSTKLLTDWNADQVALAVQLDGLTNFYGFNGLQLDDDAFGFWHTLIKSRSTDGVTRRIVQSGDELGRILFRGDDGVSFRSGVSIKAEVDTTPGSSDMPGRLSFWTTTDGTTTLAERMRIDSAGNVLYTAKTQANLGTPSNGAMVYCSDCTIANPCAGGGTGAFAKRLNGAWVCN